MGNKPSVTIVPNKINLKGKAIVLSLVSIALVGINLWTNPSKYARQVQTQVVEIREMQIKTLCTGLIGYRNAVEVKAELSETVQKKYVVEGDRVKQGDILLRLSSSKQKIALEKQLNRFKETEAELLRAQKEYEIQKQLYRKQAVAKSSVEKAEGDLEKAQKSLEFAKQEYELEQKNFEKVLIVAPSSGVVLTDLVQKEQSVEQGKVLFVIGTPNQFQMNGKIDELNLRNILVNSLAEIQVDAFPEVLFPGVVTKIDSQAEAGSFSKIGVKVAILDTKRTNLKPNLSAQAYLYGSVIRDAAWIPVEAIKSEGVEQWLFVLDTKNKARKRPIKTGLFANNQVELLEGVNLGEKVVVNDIDFLREGELVKSLNE